MAPVPVGEDGNPLPTPDDLEPLTKEAFWTVFQTCFQLPGLVIPDFAPVAIQPDEEPQGRAASDACYDLLEIYYPKALIPGGDVLSHVLVAGGFFIGKAMIVRTILAQRKAPKPAPVATVEHAPAANAAKPPEQQSPMADYFGDNHGAAA